MAECEEPDYFKWFNIDGKPTPYSREMCEGVSIIHHDTPYFWFHWVFTMNLSFKNLRKEFLRDPKEISESAAVLGTMFSNCGNLRRDRTNVTFISIGDGKHSHTCNLLRGMCGWEAISVDPIAIPIKSVKVYSNKIEDVKIQCKPKCVVA